MFINPYHVVAEGWVTGIKNPKTQIQPNAIDFTLDQLFRIENTLFVVNEQQKRMRELTRLDPIVIKTYYGIEGQFWELKRSCVYDGMSDMYVKVPDGYAAFLIIRSTFNRNGIQLASGLYDSGFEGHIGFVIYPRIGCNLIAPGTRIGQIVFVEAQNVELYQRGYSHQKGTYGTGGQGTLPKEEEDRKEQPGEQNGK